MRRIATLLLIIASAASCATSLPNSQPFPVWETNAKEDYCGISVLSSVWREQVFLNWHRLSAARPRKRYPSILRVRERLRNRPLALVVGSSVRKSSESRKKQRPKAKDQKPKTSSFHLSLYAAELVGNV